MFTRDFLWIKPEAQGKIDAIAAVIDQTAATSAGRVLSVDDIKRNGQWRDLVARLIPDFVHVLQFQIDKDRGHATIVIVRPEVAATSAIDLSQLKQEIDASAVLLELPTGREVTHDELFSMIIPSLEDEFRVTLTTRKRGTSFQAEHTPLQSDLDLMMAALHGNVSSKLRIQQYMTTPVATRKAYDELWLGLKGIDGLVIPETESELTSLSQMMLVGFRATLVELIPTHVPVLFSPTYHEVFDMLKLIVDDQSILEQWVSSNEFKVVKPERILQEVLASSQLPASKSVKDLSHIQVSADALFDKRYLVALVLQDGKDQVTPHYFDVLLGQAPTNDELELMQKSAMSRAKVTELRQKANERADRDENA